MYPSYERTSKCQYFCAKTYIVAQTKIARVYYHVMDSPSNLILGIIILGINCHAITTASLTRHASEFIIPLDEVPFVKISI